VLRSSGVVCSICDLPPRFPSLPQSFKALKSKAIFRFNPKAFAFFQIAGNAL